MVQKAANFHISKMTCFPWLSDPNSHGSQSDIMLTDIAKAD